MGSYTLIDNVFGGHLLSSIVCEECKTCLQRVEPFLDLSLPIVDETKSSHHHHHGLGLITHLAEQKKEKLSNKYNKLSGKHKSSKKGDVDANDFKKETTSSHDNEEIVDSKREKMSKHQEKKMRKQTKKSKKKGGKNQEKEDESEK